MASRAVGHRGVRLGIEVLSIGLIERDPSHYGPGLQTNPRLGLELSESSFGDLYLARTSLPVAVATIARVLSEAEAYVIGWCHVHAGQQSIPLIAPCIAVVMSGEHRHQARRMRDGLHKLCILGTIRAGSVVPAVSAPPLRLRRKRYVIIDPGFPVRVHASFL